MTLIYVHHDEKSNCVEIFSDSVISSNTAQITDMFPKINILNIRSREHDNGRLIQDTQLGFAFAGSTLSAQAVFSSSTAFLQNLASSNNALVSIDDACCLISKIALAQIKKISELRQNPTQMFAKMVVTGFCPVLKEVVIYTIIPEIANQQFGIKLEKIGLNQVHSPNSTSVFGSGVNQFIEYAKEHEDKGAFELFYSFLKQCDMNDVGGYVQYGVSHSQGFEIFPVIETARQHDGNETVMFRQLAGIGLDTNNLISKPESEDDRVIVGRLFRGSLSR